MRRKATLLLAPLLALALAALAFPLYPARAQGGSVQGKIINQTTGEQVSGQPLLLHVTLPDKTTIPDMEATSDQNGGFALESVDLTPGTVLALCTTYQNVMYHDPFEPSVDGSPVSRDLAVYEATNNDDNISLEATHVIFYPNPEQGTVEVMEFLMFQNAGNRTYVGATEGGTGSPGETIHFTLPEGASYGALHQGISDQEALWHDGGFCSLAPVYPGQQNVVYSYVLPYSRKGALQFVRPLDYHPAEVVVMTYGNQGLLSGPGVVSQGSADVGGMPYGLYRAVLAPSQMALDLELTGLTGGGSSSAMAKVLAGSLTALGLFSVLFFAVMYRRRPLAVATVGVRTPRRRSTPRQTIRRRSPAAATVPATASRAGEVNEKGDHDEP